MTSLRTLFFMVSVIYVSKSNGLDTERKPELTMYHFDNDGSGSYSYSFKTTDRIYKEETGTVVYNDGKNFVAVNGIYAFITPDNKIRVVSYTADENGYRIKKTFVRDNYEKITQEEEDTLSAYEELVSGGSLPPHLVALLL